MLALSYVYIEGVGTMSQVTALFNDNISDVLLLRVQVQALSITKYSAMPNKVERG